MAVAVVHTTRTGHVLAAFEAVGREGPPPTVAELVGTGLPLTLGAGGSLVVTAEQLATAEAERVPGLLDQPLTFGVGTGRTPMPLSPWISDEPVRLTKDGVHLMLDRTSVGQPTKVLVVLTGPGLTPEVTLLGQVFTGRKATTIGLALAEEGRYTVLTLAEGWHGRLETLGVTK
ncbi:hypothetical protein ACTI_60560 [Actinoplanes sp. OR16]|uniref:hypothetical protein n=1 Tax=Actinoplanes sp. OR16 TaxID=946334 RepID=UPI000F71C3F2|nr:hypothetical protein [Actinoplanes sp. OR16]BBH69371.1 hypothetical protein ACTI_60560 [Actinoplanes sp. OR16]